MDHSTHAMVSPDIETLNYSMLKSNGYHVQDAPVRELRFELTGNMNRYVWVWIIKCFLKPIKFN
jgi:hypothetical protein